MTLRLAANDVQVALPAGWEGRILRRDTPLSPLSGPGADAFRATGTLPLEPLVVLHAATFPIPATMGDFGGGAVDGLRPSDVLVCLLEHQRSSAATALFRATGMPRLRPSDFDPMVLRKLIEGQSGVQRFFTVAGRAFCLYVVLGSHLRRFGTAPLANQVLAGITIS